MSRRRPIAWGVLATLIFGLAQPSVPASAAPPTAPTPVGASATIEAEDFGLGGGANGFNDTTSENFGGAYRDTPVDIEANPTGHNVGWIEVGEWLEYPIAVAQRARYRLTLSLASAFAGARSIRVEVDGTVRNRLTFDSEGAGWYAFSNANAGIGWLDAGQHVIRLVFESESFNVDRLTLTAVEGASNYPGQPPAGTALWGAAYNLNGDVVPRYEIPAGGANLQLRRTYFQWDQRNGYLIDLARDDVAHGRIPWVSLQTPGWNAIASGQYDAQLDAFLRQLDTVGGPVWLTFHHEPEGGGGINNPDDPAGPAGHRAMNRRVRQRMNAVGTHNIALALILMDWTWDNRSGRNPDDWWEPGTYDILGFDTYTGAEPESLIDADWLEARQWAAARGVDMAVAEWGMKGSDAAAGARVREIYDHSRGSATDGRGARVVGLCAFDSPVGHLGGWVLQGSQYTTFIDILRSTG